MENFFDVATPEEIREIWDEDYSPEKYESEKKEFECYPDTNYVNLFKLYYFTRNEKSKALTFLEKINDSQYKLEIYQLYIESDFIFD